MMLHHRSRIATIAISALAAWMAGAGCQSDDGDEAAQLQALLHDEPLHQVPPGVAARTSATAAR